MNRLRRRIPWIIVPLLLIVPLVLVACGGEEGITEEDVERIVTGAVGAIEIPEGLTEEDVARIVEEGSLSASDVENLIGAAMEGTLTADQVSSIVAEAETDDLTLDEVQSVISDVVTSAEADDLTPAEVETAIRMALAMAAEEAAMAAMMAEEEAAMMAMKAEEERLQQIYASFFSGQTVRLLVGFSAGGGYDTYGRAIARHIGKHIPGNPEVVVENVTGGGSLVLANQLYNDTEADGLTIGLWNSNHVFLQSVYDDPATQGQIRFDGNGFGWLGAPSDGNPVCAIMGFAGLTEASDILAPGARNHEDERIAHGSTAAVGGSLSDIPRITNEFVGTDHEIVSGYRGTARVRLGLQGKEVDAACWGWESMGVTARSMLDAEGDDKFIPYAMVFESSDPEIADLPLLGDFIDDPDDKALYDLWAVGYRFQRPWTTPRNTAPELINVLRRAFDDTMADPEFIADAEASGLYLNPQTGEDIEQWVSEILQITPEQKEALQFMVTVDEG